MSSNPLLFARRVFKPSKFHLNALKLNRTLASASSRLYQPGAKYCGYTVKRSIDVPEFELTAVELVHDKTGAQHLHIDRDDRNNVFSMVFKTNPPDATGVPHILEHTTLCGSQKFPVRDPFFKMLNRSLSNFMNAMTGHDYTFYPFATTNEIDFTNLRDVYTDATLSPLLNEEDFFQEGWRLESEDPKDKTSPLTFKGVVYNEMKGQMSSASYLFYIRFQENIYPSLNNSGGDPAHITDLGYGDLVDFHSYNYHPSNSRVFTYGDILLKDHLQHLDKVFKTFGRRATSNEIKQPINLTESKRVLVKGPVDPMVPADGQVKTSLTWLASTPTDIYETFCLKVLGSLLMDGHSSPLHQALIDTGLGSDFSVNSGMDTTTAANFFTVGLQGISEDKIPEVEIAIRTTLNKVMKEGIDPIRIEAIIHQMELGRKDKKSNFGMQLLYSVAPGWVNNIDSFELLKWNETISRFRNDLSKGRFLENLIQKYFAADKPTFSFTMLPDDNFEKQLEADEKARLEQKVNALDEEDKEIIYKRGLRLLEKQTEKEDLTCLPTLHVNDIPKTAEKFPLVHSLINLAGTEKVDLQKRLTGTNGITYFRAIRQLNNIPEDLYPYLPLFCDALTNLGTKSKTMAELEEQIKLKTGGLSAGVNARPSPSDINSLNLQLSLSGVALDQNVEPMFDLWSQLLLETNFENTDKLISLIKAQVSNNLSSLAQSGHSYARSVAASYLTPVKAISEQLSGVQQVKFLNDLTSMIENGTFADVVIPKLKELQQLIVASSKSRIALTCGENAADSNEKLAREFINKLPASALEDGKDYLSQFKMPLYTAGIKTNVRLPFQVSYIAASLKGVSYTHEDGAPLQVLSNLLTYKHLHHEIREKGGAYGGGAGYSATEGIFSYYSYRDPNPMKSLETVSKAGEFAVGKDWTDEDLEQAKLTIFQGVDSPISVKSEGMIEFVDGITDEMRETRRKRLLEVEINDVKRVAQKYLIDNKETSFAVVGPKKDEIDDSWNVIEMGGAAEALGEMQ